MRSQAIFRKLLNEMWNDNVSVTEYRDVIQCIGNGVLFL